jgi:hypothetical protein
MSRCHVELPLPGGRGQPHTRIRAPWPGAISGRLSQGAYPVRRARQTLIIAECSAGENPAFGLQRQSAVGMPEGPEEEMRLRVPRRSADAGDPCTGRTGELKISIDRSGNTPGWFVSA